MKKIFTLILLALLPGVSILADGTRGISGSMRYISLKDGQVVAIPEKYILNENVADGICTLTLEGDTTFSYSQGNVLSISDKYDYPYYRIRVKNYMIFYAVIDDVMEIRRLVYTSRDMKRYL